MGVEMDKLTEASKLRFDETFEDGTRKKKNMHGNKICKKIGFSFRQIHLVHFIFTLLDVQIGLFAMVMRINFIARHSTVTSAF